MEWCAPAVPGDPVSSLLNGLRWTATGYTRHELGPGSDRRFAGREARLHAVVSGTATVRDPAAAVRLRTDDVLLTLRGGDYAVRAETDTVLVSAALEPDTGRDAQLAALPAWLLSCEFSAKEPLASVLLARIEAEVASGRPGVAPVVTQLANVVAAIALRTWVEGGCDVENRHFAAADPDIARVLEAVRERPGDPWTVADLARVAHASRSAFAERFRATLGESPARYVLRVRMERAKRMLADEGVSVARAAVALGYTSEAAFSRAFRRVHGTSPGTWSRSTRRPPS
ncbi:helix-turn-helix domain-containing protein [Cryptosporangium phraense]|uniref:AraC family transcriptional regulator n=1 Tax=Cryptosporangium phraense TaxID=2593070 RepID=A0A545AKW4_9ACTN|nr:AraC family transcriptional regulator [Cryptosporangium phraense]TQS41953.1 AraC family transcriptional regulator [Cryptosporangium phraense]